MGDLGKCRTGELSLNHSVQHFTVYMYGAGHATARVEVKRTISFGSPVLSLSINVRAGEIELGSFISLGFVASISTY